MVTVVVLEAEVSAVRVKVVAVVMLMGSCW